MIVKVLKKRIESLEEQIEDGIVNMELNVYDLAYYITCLNALKGYQGEIANKEYIGRYTAYVVDEIEGVEKYYEEYLETKMERAKQIAKQEAEHADFWLSYAMEQGEDPNVLNKLRQQLLQLVQKLG